MRHYKIEYYKSLRIRSTMDKTTAIDVNVWKMILQLISVVDVVRLISTCRRLHERFRDYERIREWRARWYACVDITNFGSKITHIPHLFNYALIDAATIGDLGLVQVFARGAKIKGWAIYRARLHGHTEVVNFLYTFNLPTLYCRALPKYSPHVDEFVHHATFIRYEEPKGYAVSTHIINEAVRVGDLGAITDSLIQSAVRDESQGNQRDYINLIAELAARNGHLHILQWMCERESMKTAVVRKVHLAVRGDHYHVIEWFVLHWDHRYQTKIVREAVNHCKIGVLQKLTRAALDMTYTTNKAYHQACSRAIVLGDLELLQWLHKHLGYFRLFGQKRLAARWKRSEIYDYINRVQNDPRSGLR